MAKQDKTLAKLCADPAPSNIKWDELKSALEGLGYRMSKGSGSRRKFVHKTTNALISCHEPHPAPEVKAYVIRQVVEHLKAQGLIS